MGWDGMGSMISLSFFLTIVCIEEHRTNLPAMPIED